MLIVHGVKSMHRVNLGSACILKGLEKGSKTHGIRFQQI